jgi:DNA-binding NarL/FixJ family response regulator
MKNLSVMIVSHPGTWQRVLQKHMESYPFVQVVSVAGGSLSAFQFAMKQSPDLVIIDSSLPFDDLTALVQNLKLENPAIRSVVIADTTQQRRSIIRSGADYTIASFNFEDRLGEIIHQLTNEYP